jgi:hypothetical protein
VLMRLQAVNPCCRGPAFKTLPRPLHSLMQPQFIRLEAGLASPILRYHCNALTAERSASIAANISSIQQNAPRRSRELLKL